MSSKHPALSRRTALRGMGVALGLPLLDAMIPAAPAAPPASPSPAPLRLMYIYIPMGVDLDEWTPAKDNVPLELTPTLEPLANVKDHVLVLSGLQHRREDEAGNPHPRGSSTFLSTAPIGKVDSAGFCTDISVDQLAARKIGADSRLTSLALTCQRGVGKHSSNISWRAPGVPTGQEINPRQVFLRMFGDPKGDVCRRSLLDRVMEEARDLRVDLGAADRRKVDEYLESVRAIEKQIQATEKARQTRGAPDMPLPEAIPASYAEHVRTMSDLAVLAMQNDATRVSTFMYALENGAGVGPISYRFLDIPEDLHSLTHHSDSTRKAALEKIKKIDRFNIEMLAHMLEKMKSVKEGEKTLLDNVMVMYGSGISWGNRHNTDNVPILLCGGGQGTIDGGRHLRYAKGTPVANLHLSMMDRVGIKLDRIADSTERLGGLTL